MNVDEATKIVARIVENGRAANNEELKNEFEFDASNAGFNNEEIEDVLKSPWFPWI